jgi:VWFA-related protein
VYLRRVSGWKREEETQKDFPGATDVLSKQDAGKVMVVLTNGVDQESNIELRDALKAAQQVDAVCFVLLLFNPPYGNDKVAMQQVAEQTGGRVIWVIDPGKFAKAFAQIFEELRSQNSLAYSPIDEKHDGKFRHISIKSKNGYKVQARKGYFAPPDRRAPGTSTNDDQRAVYGHRPIPGGASSSHR